MLYDEVFILYTLYFIQLLYDEVSRGKQQLLYTAMLRSASVEAWGRALRLSADRSRGAVLIHCAQGKDRTGAHRSDSVTLVTV